MTCEGFFFFWVADLWLVSLIHSPPRSLDFGLESSAGLWAINGIFQGLGSPSCARIINAWCSAKDAPSVSCTANFGSPETWNLTTLLLLLLHWDDFPNGLNWGLVSCFSLNRYLEQKLRSYSLYIFVRSHSIEGLLWGRNRATIWCQQVWNQEVTNPCNEESQILGDPVDINLIQTPGPRLQKLIKFQQRIHPKLALGWKERGCFWSMWNVSNNLGGALAPLMVGLGAAAGWRGSLLLAGFFGMHIDFLGVVNGHPLMWS